MRAHVLTLLVPSRRTFRAAVLLVAASLAQTAWATSSTDTRGVSEIRIEQAESGHYVTTAVFNGVPVPVIVDTGASQVVLTYDDALRAGASLTARDFTEVAQTANGTTRFAAITLSVVAVGPVVRHDIKALVAERGQLSSSLLGMSFLSKLSKVGTREGLLVLTN